MANGVRINNLNQATSLNDTDTITIVQDDENKKASISLFDKGGTYTQSVVNTIPDLITTSKANVETTKQAIDEKFGDDKFSAQIITSQEMSSVGVSDDGSVDASSQVQDGFMESAILKGQTLVNLVDLSQWGEQEKITLTADGTAKTIELGTDLPIKPNTKYLTIIPIYENTINNKLTLGGWDYYSQQPEIRAADGTGIIKIIKTTKKSFSGNRFYLELWKENTSGQITFGKPMVIEYQEGMENWDISYFEGMRSVKMPVLTTLDNKWTNIPLSLIENCEGISGWTAFRCSYPSVKVTARLNNFLLNETQFRIAMNNKPIDLTDFKEKTMTESNVKWIGFHTLGGTIGGGEIGNLLEYLTTGTLQLKFEIENEKFYPAYDNSSKSNILTVNEEVELRGVGDVKDELNLLTGETTQRVGEMVLDGVDMAMSKDSTNGDYVRFNLKKYKGKNITDHDMKVKANLKCDRLPVLTDGTNSRECIHNGGANDYKLMIWLHKSKLNSLDNDGICQYLQSNPITVQYELKTPIVKTVDLNSGNGDVKTPIVYKNGHILLQSDDLIPELHYSIPVSYSGLIAQNIMTNLKHSWRLDELEIMAYTSIVNSQYESLILVATAETNEVVVSSDYVQDESLYNMLKVLVNANALENADEKINVFYLYGKLSDEMYLDLIMGDDM